VTDALSSTGNPSTKQYINQVMSVCIGKSAVGTRTDMFLQVTLKQGVGALPVIGSQDSFHQITLSLLHGQGITKLLCLLHITFVTFAGSVVL
jgi:hypothetical protein